MQQHLQEVMSELNAAQQEAAAVSGEYILTEENVMSVKITAFHQELFLFLFFAYY